MNARRQIIAAIQNQLDGGKKRPPDGAAPIWNAFAHLSQSRTWHAHGPNPISFAEIEAYCRLMRLPLEPRHIEIIRAMDAIWINHTQDQIATKQTGATRKRVPPSSRAKLSATLFDAMFK